MNNNLIFFSILSFDSILFSLKLLQHIDPNENQFEVLVEKINGNMYLTHGWSALHDFYNIQYGALVILLYNGMSQFELILKDKFDCVIHPPKFDCAIY
jgi:hypothetical protein